MRALIAALLAFFVLSGAAGADQCHPALDPDRPQFVVGYGSLMEAESKKRSAPTAGLNHPVRLSGFQRAWNTRGAFVGFGTTFLGVEAAEKAQMVAAAYSDPDRTNIAGTDARERSYCRKPVDPAQVDFLDGWALPADAQVWIYVNKPDNVVQPDANRPIVQSYVDIFLTGCFQLEKQLLPDIAARLDFPAECIRTTAGWSVHWKNDRIYPRRPFIYQRNAGEIDRLLAEHLPDYFSKIEIE